MNRTTALHFSPQKLGGLHFLTYLCTQMTNCHPRGAASIGVAENIPSNLIQAMLA